ncbi:hypothetical protein ACGFNU_39660 [Spirillospora sp. NPDC048911]|uniref:hypothetical protein n=1 Tax=Spirillospora sp. NPDC048911 TaxID=3364527 RepID=UPI003714D89F
MTGRRSTSPLDLAPVHSAAVMAMLGGVVAARRLAARTPPDPLPRVPWHALDPEQAAERALRLRPGEDATPRRPSRGPSRPVRAVTEVAQAVGHELRDPLTPVLVLGAAASAVVGSGVDAALVGGVMAGNALISGVQRARAELRSGESQPVTKTLEAVPGADLAERSCMVYEDTTVLAGRAYAVAVATGAATQGGRAGRTRRRAAVIETPGVSLFFGCVPLGPLAWAQVLASATVAVGPSAYAPQAIERLDAWWSARSETAA